MNIPIYETRQSIAVALLSAVLLILGVAACDQSPELTETEAEVQPDVVEEVAVLTEAEAQGDVTEAVQPRVDEATHERAASKRREILEEALAAVGDTRKALLALDSGDKKSALSQLESAAGKLEIVIAREPDLVLAPVATSISAYDLYADPETIRRAIRQAEILLARREVQKARRLVDSLASEVVISTTELPLGTYPDAINEAARLIDEGASDLAKIALQSALDTLVVDDFTLPLPILRAESLLDRAEVIVDAEKRTEADDQRVRELLSESREQIEIAELLGYGNNKDHEFLFQELDSIEQQTATELSGSGIFDGLKKRLSEIHQRYSPST